jgi:hypothetical protein
MKDLGMQALIGREVISAKIHEDKDFVILETTKGALYLSWEGDCCASCYIAAISGSENLIGSSIQSVEDSEWKDIKNEGHDVIESMGTKIKTALGYVTFETRVAHNGYYGGQILVTEEPLGGLNPTQLKELEDFGG